MNNPTSPASRTEPERSAGSFDPLCPDPAGCLREGCNQNRDGSVCDRFVEPVEQQAGLKFRTGAVCKAPFGGGGTTWVTTLTHVGEELPVNPTLHLKPQMLSGREMRRVEAAKTAPVEPVAQQASMSMFANRSDYGSAVKVAQQASEPALTNEDEVWEAADDWVDTHPPTPPAPAVQQEATDCEFEVWQDGMAQAGTSGPRQDALREAEHYACQYGQDGPVQVFEVTRTLVASTTPKGEAP